MQTTPKDKVDDYVNRGWWGRDTLSDLFDAACARTPDQVALIDPPNRNDFVEGDGQRLTFADIATRVGHIVQVLFDNGLRQGDKIVVQMPNVHELVLVYLAAARLGLVVSPVALQYDHFELEHVGQTIGPDAYIAFDRVQGKQYGHEKGCILGDSCTNLLFGDDGAFCHPGGDGAACRAYVQGITVDANDIFTICWTSGTTGRAKGVPRSYNHWLSSTLACSSSLKLEPGCVMLNPFPFINMAAIGGFLFYWLQLRATMVLHHPFDPHVFLSQLQDESVEYTLAPPAVLNRLIQIKDQIKASHDLSSLRLVGSGSAPLNPEMIAGFKTEFGIDVLNIFGSNEGTAMISGPRDVPDATMRALLFPRFGRAEYKWDNALAAQLQTRLLDTQTGEEITEPEKPGELVITGSTVFDGYYKSPDDNREAFTKDGFFHTGDLFAIAGEDNRFYRFVGRCKALIIRGGVNISPEEIDGLIESHPAVLEGVAVAFPDDVLGERICAVIVPRPGMEVTLDSLVAHFRACKVAKFKWPECLHLLDALPRNAMNKVVRRDLEALIA